LKLGVSGGIWGYGRYREGVKGGSGCGLSVVWFEVTAGQYVAGGVTEA